MNPARSLPALLRSASVRFLPALAVAAFGTGTAWGQAKVAVDNPTFTTTLTGFRTSLTGRDLRLLTATVHFHNKTKAPLALGAERAKVIATDDQGNRFVLTSMRGIGTISGSSVDAKFVVPPGGGADALFELGARLPENVVRGMAFDLSLTVREIVPLVGDGLKMGAERAMAFTGLKTNHAATPADTGPPSAQTADLGDFTAEVVRAKPGFSVNRRLRTVDLTVRFKNTSDKPVVLAYEGVSSFAIDDRGARYVYGRPGTHDTSFAGIGLAASGKVDPQFSLAPGEAREAHFVVVRDADAETLGNEMTYYVALDGLEILPSEQIRVRRQYSVAIPGVAIKG